MIKRLIIESGYEERSRALTETVGVTFDVDALREVRRGARRRLRPDGIAQYVEIAGEFARFAEDPWADGSSPASR